MKKIYFLSVIALAVFILSNCGSSKKVASADAPKLTYDANIHTLVETNCSPCHIPAKGGRKKAYDSFASVQGDIDEIIRRIQLNPGERGFMPFKGAKLSDSTVALFKKWKEDGLTEK
jgi:mono/diheme cytochrome c family protein